MRAKEYVKNNLTKINPENGDTSLKVDFEGNTEMPFWNDDLKVKVILALLETIDHKNYANSDMYDQASKDYENIIEYTKAAFGYDF